MRALLNLFKLRIGVAIALTAVAGLMVSPGAAVSPWQAVTLEQLGRAKRIEVAKENTTIIDGAGDTKAIEARVKAIRAQIEEATSDYDREKL